MLGLPLALGVALVLSYVGFALIVSAAVTLRQVRIPRVQVLIWGGLALGAVSIAIRTVYFSIT